MPHITFSWLRLQLTLLLLSTLNSICFSFPSITICSLPSCAQADLIPTYFSSASHILSSLQSLAFLLPDCPMMQLSASSNKSKSALHSDSCHFQKILFQTYFSNCSISALSNIHHVLPFLTL